MPPARRNDTGGASGLAYIGMAVTQFVAPILIGVWLDRKYDWTPWGLIVGGTFGAIGGIVVLMAMNRKLNRELREGGKPPARD